MEGRNAGRKERLKEGGMKEERKKENERMEGMGEGK